MCERNGCLGRVLAMNELAAAQPRNSLAMVSKPGKT
jgi:hypothetical protein